MPTPTTPEVKKIIYHKIATVQSAIGAIVKTKTNGHFGNKYFDVNDLAEQLIPLLAEQNILMTMPIGLRDGRNTIQLCLKDLDSEATQRDIFAEMYLPEGLTIQQLGGAITYLRRYLPVSYFYLQAEDDDGNQASQIRTTGVVTNVPNNLPGTTASGAPTAATKRTEAFQKADLDNIPTILLDEEDPLNDLLS